MNSSYTLLDVIQVVFRHKAKCIFAAALTMTLAVLAIRFWPRSYQSETKLLVKLGRESVTLDPTANTGKLVSNVEGSRESEVNAAVEVLGSRALIDQVVQKIGVGRLAQAGADTDAPQWLSQAAESTKGFVKQASSALLGKDREVSEHEKCVTKLHKKIKCETTAQQSNVITTIALAKTPEMAQEVLTTLVDCFLDEHIRINRVEGSMEFFAKQTKSLEKELSQARNALRDAKNRGGLVSVREQQRALETQIAELQQQVYLVEAEAKSSEVTARDMQQLVAGMPERMQSESATGFDNAAADSMQTELFKLQMKKLDFMSRYTADHPMIKAIREQAREAERIVKQQQGTRSRSTTKMNPTRESVSVALTTEIAKSGGLEAQAIVLKDQLRAAREELQRLNDSEVAVSDLEVRVKLLEDSYARYYENLEQARINDALEKEKISNISVVQAPTLVVKPKYPNKLISLALATIASVFAGFMTALVAEQVRTPLPQKKTEEDTVPVIVVRSKDRLKNGSAVPEGETKELTHSVASTRG